MTDKDDRAERTLIDLVEDIHRMLIEDEEYLALLNAVYDRQAVHGSLAFDNAKAAVIIRDKAREIDSRVADEKLATISKALNAVLRRYGLYRRQRKTGTD